MPIAISPHHTKLEPESPTHAPGGLPRHAPGERFLKGPLEWDWWSSADRLGGSALHVASFLKQRQGWLKSLNQPFRATELAELGLGRTAARDGLDLLASAGLTVIERLPGRRLQVRLVVPGAMAAARADRAKGRTR